MAKRKVVYRYPRHRFRRHRRGGMTIPLAPIAGLIAGLADPIQRAIGGDYMGALDVIGQNYTGYSAGNHDWIPQRMMNGVVPLVVGLMVHKFVGGSPLNANAALGRAKVPLIRI